MRQLDVPGGVLEDERPRPLEHAGASARDPRPGAPRRDRLAARFAADQPHARVVEEPIEDADGVAAATDAGDDHVGQAPRLLEDLRARFASDDGLELADHQRIGMRTERGAEQVIGIVDVGAPVAHRLVDGVLERAAARLDAVYRCAEQLHAHDVQRLAAHVLSANVDAALETEQGAAGGGRNAVLSGAGLRHDAALPHALGQQRLAERVVDLVRAGVGQVFALEKHADTWRVQKDPPYPTRLSRRPGPFGPGTREVGRLVQRRGAADIVLQQPIELVAERLVLARGEVARPELPDRPHERFGNEAAAVRAEVAARVGLASPEHRPINGCRPGRLRHCNPSNAPRALAMNCATLSNSFTPGADSTPEDTSTP